MGVTKTAGFTDLQNRQALLFKALGHPARVAIVELLIEKQACICNDLVEELPLSQSTVSQHLRELKEVGIIKGEIEGTSICYCINKEVMDEIGLIFYQLIQSIKTTKRCC